MANPNEKRLADIRIVVAQIQDVEAPENRAKSDAAALAALVADLDYSLSHGGTSPSSWGGQK